MNHPNTRTWMRSLLREATFFNSGTVSTPPSRHLCTISQGLMSVSEIYATTYCRAHIRISYEVLYLITQGDSSSSTRDGITVVSSGPHRPGIAICCIRMSRTRRSLCDSDDARGVCRGPRPPRSCMYICFAAEA